jgi:transposase-like protein
LWWIWEARDEGQRRRWATRFCRRWQLRAPAIVEEFKAELHRVLAYLRWPAAWRHRLRTTLAEGFFRHLRMRTTNLSVGRQTRLPTG